MQDIVYASSTDPPVTDYDSEVPDPILRAFGRAVLLVRRRKGWRQEDLASAVPKTYRSDISDIERGERNLGLIALFRFAEALGVPPSELVEITERELRAEPGERGGG